MPILLFPPPRFKNSKIGIGKNWHKLAKIVKIARLALAKIGINWQKLKIWQKLINHINCALGIFFRKYDYFSTKM